MTFEPPSVSATDCWEKLTPASTKPQPRSQSIAFVFTQFRSHGGVRYMGRPQHDYFGAPPTPASTRHASSRPFRSVAAQILEEAESRLDPRVDEATRYGDTCCNWIGAGDGR